MNILDNFRSCYLYLFTAPYSAPLVAELSSTRAAHKACAELIAHAEPEFEVFEIASR